MTDCLATPVEAIYRDGVRSYIQRAQIRTISQNASGGGGGGGGAKMSRSRPASNDCFLGFKNGGVPGSLPNFPKDSTDQKGRWEKWMI